MKPFPLIDEAARLEIRHLHLAEHRASIREAYRRSTNPKSLMAVALADKGYGWEDIVRIAQITPEAAKELVLGIPR